MALKRKLTPAQVKFAFAVGLSAFPVLVLFTVNPSLRQGAQPWMDGVLSGPAASALTERLRPPTLVPVKPTLEEVQAEVAWVEELRKEREAEISRGATLYAAGQGADPATIRPVVKKPLDLSRL